MVRRYFDDGVEAGKRWGRCGRKTLITGSIDRGRKAHQGVLQLQNPFFDSNCHGGGAIIYAQLVENVNEVGFDGGLADV